MTDDATKPARAKRRSPLVKALDAAIPGDLILLYAQHGDMTGTVQSIDQVSDIMEARDIVARWKAWGVMTEANVVEVWEVGRNFYRKR